MQDSKIVVNSLFTNDAPLSVYLTKQEHLLTRRNYLLRMPESLFIQRI